MTQQNPTANTSNVTVSQGSDQKQIPLVEGQSLLKTLFMSALAVPADCGGQAICGKCQVRILDAAPPPPTKIDSRHISPKNLEAGFRLACQVIPRPGMRVELPAIHPQPEWRSFLPEELADIPIANGVHSSKPGYGLAIDLGTTHIRITLWDLAKPGRVAGRIGLNPQMQYGSDILNRLTLAQESPVLAKYLGQMVIRTLARAITAMLNQVMIPSDKITTCAVVGNTAMLSLFTCVNYNALLDPKSWIEVIDFQPRNFNSLIRAWGLATNAKINVYPALGGFVGSDLWAGILSTALTEGPPGSLLIDYGTNSELALWDGDKLHITSTAGGPAFEGSGILCGMPAQSGAIYRVTPATSPASEFELSVVGGGTPQGICGAGMIDAIATLFGQGRLDKIGRFVPPAVKEIVIAATMPAITISTQDIDTFQRAKAAIAAGMVWLCHRAGIPMNRLRRVCISGAFGQLIHIGNARDIGLLPPISADLIENHANSALTGCEMMMLQDDAGRQTVPAGLSLQVYNVAEDAAFETLFIENLYIQQMVGYSSSDLPMGGLDSEHA